jgi:2-polyprenyl-3-methyl-5-hydroxy-6-metoxy-1,4-benzoquinol methylase
VSLGASGRLNESRAALEKALLMQPEYAEAHDNLGNTLQDLGEHAKAISEHFHAITLEPNYTTAKANLGRAVAMVRFTSSNTQLYPVLADLLKNGNLVQVKLIAKSVTSLLRNDPTLQNLVAGKQESYQTSEAMSVVKSLDKFQLLHEFLRVSPLLDLQIESLLTALRRAILLGLAEINADPELIRFLSTISLHCFVNEYIYFESAKETELITTLGLEIESAIAGGLQPDPLKVLCFSAYRLLHKQRWCESLTELSELEEINRRQVLEPLEEYTYAFNTPKLNRITDKVSKQVRAQYEENPYPRWLKVRIPRNAISVAEHCDEVGLRLLNNKIRDVTQPKILIAGCGTGQQSIGAAARYSNCQVLAIDLSLASLAYAQRKTFELKLDNLRYAQSDILTLAELGSSFDIIECSGVLHHMQDPLAGWRALVDLLKPEGLIKIGLYSELARQSISKARADIASLQIKATAAEIRAFRQQVAASSENPHRELTSFNSFYSLSEFRDLVFHVQEHQFTIPKIQDSLDELGLAFCGFEHDTKKLPKFEKFFPHNRDIYDLERWHELERSNPDTFRGMYQFWCQRY